LSLVDLSKLGAIEERTMDLEAQLRQAQKTEAVGRLTGGIAHDFNNLLTVISGSLEMLKPEALRTEEDRNLVRLARTAAARSGELTHRLLAFSWRQPLAPRRVDAAETVGTVCNLIRRTIGEDIVLSLECPEGLWAVCVDSAQLEACLVNLAINASDAMPEGGRLAIGAENVYLEGENHMHPDALLEGPYVRFHVIDTGHGIDAETLPRVIEPFFTTKDVGKGTGLGLGAAFGFATQSGGTLHIESEFGVGTTVYVYLPPDVVPVQD
jgi:signal transduction histidine kinase